MRANEVSANVVIVAHQFNPSIVNQLWLVRHGILAEDDFLEGSIFVPMVSQVRSKQFSLTILPDQMQFQPIGDRDAEAKTVRLKLGQIIAKLPETPYIAVGLNFTWHLEPTGSDTRKSIGRHLFFKSSSRLYRNFDTEDAEFGAYLSKDELGCRLKLDIKPATIAQGNEQKPLIQFAFNFHRQLPSDNRIESIQDLLENWEDARKLAESIVLGVNEDCEI